MATDTSRKCRLSSARLKTSPRASIITPGTSGDPEDECMPWHDKAKQQCKDEHYMYPLINQATKCFTSGLTGQAFML
eukprot:scaffold550007_cov42-Prasinocladus_malaysianus.AAC.1